MMDSLQRGQRPILSIEIESCSRIVVHQIAPRRMEEICRVVPPIWIVCSEKIEALFDDVERDEEMNKNNILIRDFKTWNADFQI